MATNNVYVTVTKLGPTVEGMAEPLIGLMMEGAVAELASYTKHEVSMELINVLQHPTGYYESRIVAEPVSAEQWSINDSNVIYGPWLEGIGSRNATTRFKGYATFRRVQGRMSQKATAIVQAWVDRTVGRL
ncbi:hypothetical protein ABH930_000329 [Kitasatospora sp. GAS204A]|uniref:hypothetical protein n=1 Tax=unclassified Kitasatospora TaxID=2633591 RepID=UPI002474F319|nr:hypothetical protein [Kitasatospora sp. GAS204B]MDH6116910.1 hypothetical protein [Kitasatospora sp. GAS204B]